MQNAPIALIAGVLVLLVLLIMLWRNQERRRSAELKEHFGPEYDRMLEARGGRARAERELLARKKRLDKLAIKLLPADQCERFDAAWAAVQQRFIDDPSGAVLDADALVKEVMSARGYPMGNFEQRVADLSVEHASVVDHYRAARALALASAKGQANTEDLRQAMVHYRALFTDLLQSDAPAARLSEAHA